MTALSTPDDEAHEREIMTLLAAAWRCDVRKFARFTPIDSYAIRDDRLGALVELRCLTCAVDAFPTAVLNVHKWLAMTMARVGLGIPVVWVVRWGDGHVRWVDVGEIDASAVRMFRRHDMRVHTDVEPVIDVPIEQMRVLR